MRRRRAERCALRAEIALEAGFEDDAREALEEARRLDPNAPDFDEILSRVVVRMRETVAQESAARRRRVQRFAAAAVVVLASLAGTAALMRPEAPAAIETVTASAPAPAPPATAPTPTVAAPAPAPVPVKREPAPRKVPEAAVKAPEPKPTKLQPKQPTRPPVALPLVALPPEAAPASRIELPALAIPEPTPVKPAPVKDESAEVRAALSKYEAAYSALDVVATRAVWPAVNSRSLARAFEGLESQRVSLGQCSVAIDGPGARAECNGNASWTPKVGGGTRTEPRHWAFELKNADGTWRIVRVTAR